MSGFLDQTGLSYFWEKIKNYVTNSIKVTGVKGNEESSYRTGNVNLTPANIGAAEDEHTHPLADLAPIQTKTYTGIYCANEDPAGYLYYASIRPDEYYKPWHVKMTVKMKIANRADSYATYEFDYYGIRNTYLAYRCFNTINNSSYRPMYAHAVYPTTQTGFNNGYGYAFGFRFQSSNDMNNANYSRTIDINIYEAENCTVTFLNNMVVESSVDGSPYYKNATTNYQARQTFDGTTNGYTVSGDRNSLIGYGYYRYYFHPKAGTNGIKQYSLYMKDGNGTYQSFTTTHGTGTTKAKNTAGFDLSDGVVYYHYSGTNYASGEFAGTGTATPIYHSVDFRYSSNCGSTLTNNKELYIVGTINPSDGLFYLDDTWWTQTLPTVEDGKVYIPIGWLYSSGYALEFNGYFKPVHFKNGKIQQYLGYRDDVYWAYDASTESVNIVFPN